MLNGPFVDCMLIHSKENIQWFPSGVKPQICMDKKVVGENNSPRLQDARRCSLGFMKEYGISYIYQARHKKGQSSGRVHRYFGESIMHIILPHSFSSKKKKKR